MGLIPAQEVAGTRRAGVPCSLPAVPTCLSSDSGVAGESSLGNGCARGRTWNLCSSMEELLDLYSLQWYNEKKNLKEVNAATAAFGCESANLRKVFLGL